MPDIHSIPSPATKDAGTQTGVTARTAAVSRWVPSNAPSDEPRLATVARFAARLMDRFGNLFTADEIQQSASDALSAHVADTDPHGDRAYADSLMPPTSFENVGVGWVQDRWGPIARSTFGILAEVPNKEAVFDIGSASGSVALSVNGRVFVESPTSLTSITFVLDNNAGSLTLNLGDFTSLESIVVQTDSAFSLYGVNYAPSVLSAYFAGSLIDGEINPTNLPSLQYLEIHNAPLYTTFVAIPSLTTLYLSETGVTIPPDTSAMPDLAYIAIQPGLTSFPDLSGLTSLISVSFPNATVTDSVAVDALLDQLNINGASNGILDISGGTTAAPGATGLLSIASLQFKGWIIVTN